MTLQAELDHDEQTVLEYPELRSGWSRSRNPALSAEAGTEFVRARMPAPQIESPTERRVIDLPARHGDDGADQKENRTGRRGGFRRRGPLAVALALPLLLA